MANVSSSNGLEKRPKLRFPGFDEPWKTNIFDEIFSLLPNNTLSRADLASCGDVLNVHYGDVLIKYGSILDVESDEIPYIAAGKESKKQCYLSDGDVIIADTAEDETVGKCTEITNTKNAKIEAGLHTIPCHPRIAYAPMFLGYYMNSPYYHKQLIPLMQGVKVLSVSKSNIGNTLISAPASYPEQEKIVDLLHLLDCRMRKQQEVIDNLKKYKRGLNKLVFEKITSGAKQQIPLSELCESISSGRTTSSNADGIFPLFGSTGVVGKTNIIEFDGDIVLIARVGANAGKVNYFSGQCAVTDNTLVIRVKEDLVQAKFLAFFLEYYNLHRLIFGSGQPLVTGGQLKKIKMPLVSLTTQVSLTQRLEALDSIIEVHEKYAQSLTLLKSGLMQQLFI